MANLFLTIFICAFVALVIFYQALRIRDLKKEVEHQKKIAETTQDIFDGFRARCIKEEYGYTVLRAETAINLEDGMEGVKTRLASKLSNELLRTFEPSADRKVRGEKIYSLSIKARKL